MPFSEKLNFIKSACIILVLRKLQEWREQKDRQLQIRKWQEQNAHRLELVSEELNHSWLIAGLFRQIRGHTG